MVFGVNDKDMRELIEYIKDVLEVDEGDEILVVNNVWRLIIAKNAVNKSSSFELLLCQIISFFIKSSYVSRFTTTLALPPETATIAGRGMRL